MAEDLQLLRFTALTALCATALMLPFGVGAALLLARWRGPGRALLDTLLSLPLVLPPTAVGLVLLELLGRQGLVGAPLHALGLEVVFTWKAVVLSAMVMSFPLLVRSARSAFEAVDPRLVGIARTLGDSRARAFFRVTLPLAARGIGAGTMLAFSRALGEFGATVLIAGNIPGRTQTLALAIFQRAQAGRDEDALRLVGLTTALAFAAIWSSGWLARPKAGG